MSKKVYIMLCVLLLTAVALPVRVSARQLEPLQDKVCVTPFWTHVFSIVPVLDISSGQATMAGSVIARQGAERITVDAVLVRVNANGTTTHSRIYEAFGITLPA